MKGLGQSDFLASTILNRTVSWAGQSTGQKKCNQKKLHGKLLASPNLDGDEVSKLIFSNISL
jgi:hypothetical protein